MPIVAIAAGGSLVAVFLLVWLAGRHKSQELVAVARTEGRAIVREAQTQAAALRRAVEREGREASLLARSEADKEIATIQDQIAAHQSKIDDKKGRIAVRVAFLKDRNQELEEQYQALKRVRDRAQGLKRDVRERRREARALLEQTVGVSGDEVQQVLVQRWMEEAQAKAAQQQRQIEQTASDPKYDDYARRFMDIAVSRYKNHFLTERNISKFALTPQVTEVLTEQDGLVHQLLQEVSNVQLLLSDDGSEVRLDGLDGVGREIARRALRRLGKQEKAVKQARADAQAWATRIRNTLHQEIKTLGRKAFAVLEIPIAHDEIVDLVGRLNYRTSYTQNQWLHAVEASFLAGMIAEEMGMDIKLARKATLLHDIGKALTHEIDGSHAVIGADIARRLGEDEIIANAIGAHHNDEPCNSAYAHLVAAADAMSGARPGARRELSEAFGSRVDDLKRIGGHFRGVDSVHPVHGGRELRVYVKQNEVSDLDAIEMSGKIANQIAEEMTFPGQIKVTVIRSVEAEAIAN